MRHALVVALALAFASVGCVDDGADQGAFDPGLGDDDQESADFHVDGTFTDGATEDDFDDAAQLAASHGGIFRVDQEADPPRFSAYGMTESECDALRAALDRKPYVDSTGACSDLPLE